jgi:hypothetical protein
MDMDIKKLGAKPALMERLMIFSLKKSPLK